MARSSLYQQVAAEVRRAIYTGELAPGDQIPTETDLMEAHGVSRNTVRLALGELENEGLILRMRVVERSYASAAPCSCVPRTSSRPATRRSSAASTRSCTR